MKSHYFFQPVYPRLIRVWKREANLEFLDGGHKLTGDALRLSPKDLILRHYIALSIVHMREKYGYRRFSDEDMDKGWHHNRTDIFKDKLIQFPNEGLFFLEDPMKNTFNLSVTRKKHFWQW